MTHQLTALAALAALREAWAWLQDAPQVEAQPGQRRTTRTAHMPTQRAGRLDLLLKTERAERATSDIPSEPQPVPIRPALIDAQQHAHRAITDAAWITTSALRHQPLLAYGLAWQALYRDQFRAAAVHLRIAIPNLNPCTCPAAPKHHRLGCHDQVAAEVGQLLAVADERARLVLGVGPAWTPVPGRACPRCGRRALEAEVSSLDEREWIMRCGNGCLTQRVEDHGRTHGRLGDLLALIRSVRRQAQKRERTAAA